MHRVLMIVNPISGTRSKAGIAEMMTNAMSRKGFELEVIETSGPHDAYWIARNAAVTGVDLVVVAGGDGTVNEVASGLCNTSTSLGIIPCGSGNGLARTLGIPQNFERAVEIIAGQNVVKCDYGMVNSKPFFCTFGVGFDAAVTEKFAQMKRRGRMSYIKSALLEFLTYSPKVYALEMNGTIITRCAFLIAVCNTSQYGNNAYIAPRASITDGLLDVTVVHSGSTLSTALCGIDMLTGYLDRNTLIETFRVGSVTITKLDDGAAQIDGESHDLGRRMDVKCCPGGINIVAPERIAPFKPLITPITSMIDDTRNDIRMDIQELISRIFDTEK